MLRTVAGAAAFQGGLQIANGPDAASLAWTLGSIISAGGAALIVGVATPGAGLIVALTTMTVAAMSSASASSLLADRGVDVLVTADAIAIVLLGPGAHSVDAYLFGRREIIIPGGTRQ